LLYLAKLLESVKLPGIHGPWDPVLLGGVILILLCLALLHDELVSVFRDLGLIFVILSHASLFSLVFAVVEAQRDLRPHNLSVRGMRHLLFAILNQLPVHGPFSCREERVLLDMPYLES
jgi:hypothetical protein